MPAKILITGGAGYIGTVLVPMLLNDGHHVTVLDSFLFNQPTLLDSCIDPKLTVVRGDCRDKNIITKLMKDVDYIIPLAAIVGAPACNLDTTAATSINLDAIKLILSLRSKNQRIVLPNTNSGYGMGQKGSFCTEDSPLEPISLYGRTKVDAERAVLDAGNSLTFRLATVFGLSPRMRIDLLVNDFVYRAINDKAVVIFEGHAKRNYIHIRDVGRAFVHAINNFEKCRVKLIMLAFQMQTFLKSSFAKKFKSTFLASYFWKRLLAKTQTNATTLFQTKKLKRPVSNLNTV